MAWLDAPHRGRAADAIAGDAASLVEAAPTEPHPPAGRAPADRLALAARPPAEGDRRLQGLDARALRLSAEPPHTLKSLYDHRNRRAPRVRLRLRRPFPAVFPVLTGRTVGAIRAAV